MAKNIGYALDALRAARQQEEEEEKKRIGASLDSLRQRNTVRQSYPSFEEALHTDAPEVQRERLKTLTARNLAENEDGLGSFAKTSTRETSLPSVSDLVDSLPSVKAPTADHLRYQVDKNVAAKKQEQTQEHDSLRAKADKVTEALPTAKKVSSVDAPLTTRKTTGHNLGTYAVTNFAAGVETGLTSGVRALENVFDDITTGGKRSEDVQKLTTYFQENPAAQKALMTKYGTDESIAVESIAKKAGVDPASVKGYKTQLSANYYKQEADQWAEDEDINAIAKFVFGDAAYQIGMQLPSMAAGMTLPGGGASASLTETIRDAVAGKSGTAFAKALGQGFVKGVGNAAKGNTTTWLMAANSAGSKYFQNQQEYGGDINIAQNVLDAAANGFFESFTEGIGGFSDVPSIGKFFDTRTGSTAGTLLRGGVKALFGAVEEGLEEVINVPLTGLADKLIVDPDKAWFGDGGVIDSKEMLLAGLQGALIGGVMGSVATGVSVIDTIRAPKAAKTQNVENVASYADTMNPAEIRASVELLNRESKKYGLDALDAKKTTTEMLENRAVEIINRGLETYNNELLAKRDTLIDSGLQSPENSETYAIAKLLDMKREDVTADELHALLQAEAQRITDLAKKVSPEVVDELTTAEAALPSQPTEAQTAEAAVQEEIRAEQVQRKIVSEANDNATVATDFAVRLKELAPKANLKTTQKLADATRLVQQGQMPDKKYNEALNLLKSDKVRYAVETALNIDSANPVHIDTQNAKTIRTSLQQIAESYTAVAAQANMDAVTAGVAEAVMTTEREANAITTEAIPIASDVNAPNADVNAITSEVNPITTEANTDVITLNGQTITREDFVRDYGAELAEQGRSADEVFDNFVRASNAFEHDSNLNTSEANAEAVDVSRETIAPNAEVNAITTEASTATSPRLHRLYNTEKPLTDIQSTSIEALDRLASAVNVDIYLYDSTETSEYGDSSGRYETGTDRVYVDINAGSQYEGTILRTAGHELVHFIKRWSPDEFATLSKFVEQTLVNSGADISSLVSDKIMQAAAHNATRSKEVAYEEVIADACQTVLTDTEALAELSQTNRGLFDKIMEFFRDFIDRIRGVYAEYKPTTEAGRIMAQQTQDVLDRLSSTYATALVRAGEARTEAQKLLAGEQSKLDDAKTEGGEELFDYRAIKADTDTYRDMLTKWGGMTDEQVKTLFKTLDTTISIVQKNLAALDYGYESDLNAKRPFNPVKPNSDKLYKISVDFSTLCRKRILQGVVAEKLQEQLKRPLSKEEAIEVRNRLVEVQKEGRQIEVACALCYVEAARLKIPAQVQKFMDNRASIMYNYFAENDRATKDAINAAERQKKTELGYEPTAAVKGKADKAAVRDAKASARSTYQLTEKQKAEIAYAESLPVNAFTTAQGLSELASKHEDVFAAYAAAVRAASHSKGLEADVPWRAGDSESIGDRTITSMNEGAGLRSQSWSDFQIEHLLDEIAMTIELASRGAKMHSYTKVPDYVRLLGLTGHMINMSLIPTQDGSGFDGVEGMPYETMLALRDKYPETAGNICIGVNDAQILRLLASDEIDYVIPYHKSGNSKATRKLLKIPSWSDYEGIQSEKGDGEKPVFAEWFDLAKAKETAARENANPTDPAMAEKYGVQYGAYRAMQEAADKYLALCAERNLTPKFKGKVEGRAVDLTTDPNYWKLLIDRKMINQVTGEIIEQKPVQPIFDPVEIYGENGDGGMLGRAIAQHPTLVADQNYAVETVVQKFLAGRNIDPTVAAEGITEATEVLMEYRDKALEDYLTDNSELPWEEESWDGKSFPFAESGEGDFGLNPDTDGYTDYDRFAISLLKAVREGDAVAKSNAQYANAVAELDMATAEKMVEDAARKAGYASPKLYHGTKSFGFTKLNPRMSDDGISFFATNSLDLAQTYSGKQTARELWESDDTTESVTKSRPYSLVDTLITDAGREKVTADEVLETATAELMTIASNLTRKVNAPFLAIEDDAPRVAKKIADLVAEDDLLGAKWALDGFAAEADEILETVFGNGKNGNYQFYAKTDGFLEVDAKGSNWSNIDYQPPELQELWAAHKELEKQRSGLAEQARKIKSEQGIPLSEAMERVHGLAKIDDQISDLEDIIYNSEEYQMFTGDLNTRGLSKYAHDQGFKGVLIKNLRDEGGRGLFDSYDAQDVYIFFDPAKQLKSADPVTYDDNGRVIPLSERFNAGNNDIRFEHRDVAKTKAFADFVKAYDAIYGEGAAQTIVRTTEQLDRERARQRKREATAAQMAKLPDTEKRIAAEVKRLESDRRQREKIESLQNPATRKRRLAAQKNRAQMRELLEAAKMDADMRVADQAYRDNYEMQLRLAEAKQRAEERLKNVSNELRWTSEARAYEAKEKADARVRAAVEHGKERVKTEVQRTKERQERRDYADWWEREYFAKPEAEARRAEQKERRDYQRDMANMLKKRDEQILRDNADVRDAQRAYARDIRQDPEALRNRNDEAVRQRAAEQAEQYPNVYAARQNAAAQRTGAAVISPTDAVQKAPVVEGDPNRPIEHGSTQKKGNPFGKSIREKASALPGKIRETESKRYRMLVNSAQGIDTVAEKQREAGFNVTASDLTTSVRNSKDTAAYILTDALVSRSGEVMGKSLSDVILVKNDKGKFDKKMQAAFDDYLKHKHNIDRMSVKANAFAQLDEYLNEHEWLRSLFPVDTPQPIDTRKGAFIEKLLGRSDAEIEEAHIAANLYNQYAEAVNKPVFGHVEYVKDANGVEHVREIEVVSAEQSRIEVEAYEAEQPWMKQKAEEYYEWQDAFMREWAVGTSITAEDYENMRRLYPHYVPTYREGKDAGAAASARNGKVSTGQAVKKAKGGVSEVRWVQDTLAEQVGRLVTLRRTNDLLLNLVDTGLIDGSDTLGTGIRIRPESLGYGALMNFEEMDNDRVITRAISNDGGKYTISAWDNGERITADIDEGLYESLQSLFPQGNALGKATSIGRAITTPMKAFITGYNPFFVARNVARDFGTALIQTEGSMVEYATHYARAYKYIVTKDSRWQEYQALGNTGSQRYRDDVGLAKFDKIVSPNAMNFAKKFFGTLGETTEAAARFAEYLLVAEKEGFTPEAKLHASKAAAEITTDFSRSGEFGKFINAWIPYTNAATQGVDRVLRDFKNGKALNRLGRAAFVQVLPQAIILTVIKGLGREDEYEQISDYQKDNYYLFPIADGKWIRIPKTETYGKILASGFSRTIEGLRGREDTFKDYEDVVGDALNMSWLGADSAVEGVAEALKIRDIGVVGSVVDLMLNKDFSGRDIVGSEFRDFTSGEMAPNSEQYNNDTSLLAYGLSKAVANAFSPVEVDYMLRDYMGDFYHAFVSTINVGLLQSFSAKDLMADLGETFVSEAASSFVVDPVYSNRYTSEYYDALDELGSTIAGERARIADSEERKTTLAYRTRQAVNYAYGDAISDAYKTARLATSEADKHDAREEAAALSIDALDFIERAMAGEYGSNPYDYVKYIGYGDSVAKALLGLDALKDDYAFEPNASYAPSSLKVGKDKHVLTSDERDAYKAMYAEVYAALAQEAVDSKKYRNASDKERAELLEDVASEAREETTKRFKDWLK